MFYKASAKKIPEWTVVPISILTLLLLLSILLYQILSHTNGIFMYPLDDAFIHMGIAKNLSLHGVWGSSSHTFVSASSSIIYPLLLAGIYLITGPNTITPFIVNLIAGILLLWAARSWLKKQGLSPNQQLITLLLLVVLTPLPIIICIGMEHTLQILFTFIFVDKFSQWVLEEKKAQRKHWNIPWNVIILGILTTSTRYEGIFIIAICSCILLYYRQWELSVEIGFLSFLPILIFGIISIFHANYFLPNSLLLKSAPVPLTAKAIFKFFTDDIFQRIYYDFPNDSGICLSRLLVMLPVICLLFREQLKTNARIRNILIFLATAILIHLIFAKTNWFYRYEDYLLVPSLLATCAVLFQYGRQAWKMADKATKCVFLLLSFVLISPFYVRAKNAFTRIEGACMNIYDQNYQMGQFLHTYYDSSSVAINDLGCPSYFLSGNVVDLWGLGNIEVARAKRDKYYNENFLYYLVNREKVKTAVVFDRLYSPNLLGQWKKVAVWHIPEVFVAGDADLSFYAVDTTIAPKLKTQLREFEKHLPTEVTVQYP